jgi:hypothetical protein
MSTPVSFTGSTTQLNYTSGVTAGVCSANKSLVVNASSNITGIRNITLNNLNTTNISGTLLTSNQYNITSIGLLNTCTITNSFDVIKHNEVNNGLYVDNVLITAGSVQLNTFNIISTGIAEASKALVLDGSRNINNIHLYSSNNIYLTSLLYGGYSLNATSDQLNYNNITYTGIAEPSKTLVLDSSRNITNINSLTATNLVGTNLTGVLQTASQPNITYLGNLTSLSITNSITGVTNISILNNLNCIGLSGTNIGGVLITAAQPNISSIGNLSSLSSNDMTTTNLNITNLKISGIFVTVSAIQLNYNNITSLGAAEASKILTLDSSRNITNINSLTATAINTTNLTGTVLTAAQPNILSLGTLTSLTLAGNISNVTNITIAKSFIGQLRSVTANTISSTIQTSSQPNITSLGTLTNLTVTNLGIGVTTGFGKQMEISSNNVLRLVNNSSSTNILDILVPLNGDLTVMGNNTISFAGNIQIGNSATSNNIYFNGVNGDKSSIYNTLISERLYNGSDLSELLLFKGKDNTINNLDRIRFRAGEISFQNFTGNEQYSTIADNNTAFIVKSTGKIGINTTAPDSQLEINSSNGNCLRLNYGIYKTDLNVNSSGDLLIRTSSNDINDRKGIYFNNSTNSQTVGLGSLDTATYVNGIIKLRNINGVNYIQSGIKNTVDSAADLAFGSMLLGIDMSSNKFIIKATGNVGIGTYVPNKSLSINNITGQCLRMRYNSTTLYLDQTIGSTGNVTYTINNASNPLYVFNKGIYGTLQTTSQPNITKLGTLTGLSINSASVTGITNLTVNNTLSGVNTVYSNNISGTILTRNQPNIKSIGTISKLGLTNNLKIGNYADPTDYIQLEKNSNSIIGIQLENRNGTSTTSGNKISFMGFKSVTANITWTSRTSTADNNWLSICWSSELYLFVAVADSGSGNQVMTSSDGITWTAQQCPNNLWSSVCWSPELYLFVAVAYGGVGNRVMTSPDGITWTSQSSVVNNQWVSVCWSSELEMFVAVAQTGTGNRVMTSLDGITWNIRISAADNQWQSVCWSTQLILFVAVANTGTGNRVMTSPDGITWTARTTTVDNDWKSICWSPELLLFVAVASSGSGNRVMTSPDGITWTARTSPANNLWNSICWAPELRLFIAVASSGTGNRAMYSLDGINWSLMVSSADNLWNSVCWSSELYLFASVAQSGTGNRVMTIYNYPNLETARIASVTVDSDNSNVYKFADLSFGTLNNVNDANVTERMRITSSGNICIGKTSTTHNLDINGIFRTTKLLLKNNLDANYYFNTLDSTITDNYTTYLKLGKSNSNYNQVEIGFNYITSGSNSNAITFGLTGTGEVMRFTKDYKCGIGTTTPAYALDISGGEMSISGNIYPNSNYINYQHKNTVTNNTLTFNDSIISSTSNALVFMTNNIERVRIVNGNTGIGRTPSYTLDVNGPVRVSTIDFYTGGNISQSYYMSSYYYWTSINYRATSSNFTASINAIFNNDIYMTGELNIFSDRRIKENINELSLERCKEFINNTTPVSFFIKNKKDIKYYGYIAQDIYKAGFKNLVSLSDTIANDDIKPFLIKDIDEDGFISEENQLFILNKEEMVSIMSKNVKNIFDEKKILNHELEIINNNIKNNLNEENLQVLDLLELELKTHREINENIDFITASNDRLLNENAKLEEEINNIILKLQS